jgi:hypothetical protein
LNIYKLIFNNYFRATGLAIGLTGEVLSKILVEVLLYVCFIEN